MDRSFVCPDCPEGVTHTAGARGPVPTRCRKHLTAAKNRRARRERRGFHVVDTQAAVPAEAPTPPPPDPAGSLLEDDAPAVPARMSDIVRRELDALFSTHPASASLTEAALVLARQLENPLTIADGRIAATVVRELRATLEALTAKREEAADGADLFGFGGVPASVGNASAS